MAGTSMAAPHVSGAAALLAGAVPAITPAQIETSLQLSAAPLGSAPPNNTYGYGLLNAAAAYKYAFDHFSGKNNVPQIASVPASLFFISTGASPYPFTIVIANQGTANLTINSLSLGGANPSDFGIMTDGCSGQTISALASCTVTGTFTPGASGPRSGLLSIPSNDTSTPTLNVPLHGNDPVALAQGAAIVATYSDIQTASDNCANWETIQMQALTLPGNPVINLPLGIAVSMQGGYDAAFESQPGFTTINGSLTVSKGTVIIGNVIIK